MQKTTVDTPAPRRDPSRVRPLLWRALPLMLVLASLALAAGTAGGESERQAQPDPAMWQGWLDGAAGMFRAIDRVEAEKKPMAVYFYTDWCPYCRQFERELLATAEVQRYFEGLVRVRINPEAGREEAEMARLYRVQGYPSFFIHSNQSKTLSQVNRMTLKDGRPVLMQPREFIAAVERAAER